MTTVQILKWHKLIQILSQHLMEGKSHSAENKSPHLQGGYAGCCRSILEGRN